MKIPKTPVEFDYDLWTTEDGKCMVRIKRTGEVTEVDRDVMRILRAEEKRIRRAMTGAPVEGAEHGETSTVLSLDYVSVAGGEEMEAAWLEDSHNLEATILAEIMETEFLKELTEIQLDVFKNCLSRGISMAAYAKAHNISASSVKDTRDAIRKKYKKFFDVPAD